MSHSKRHVLWQTAVNASLVQDDGPHRLLLRHDRQKEVNCNISEGMRTRKLIVSFASLLLPPLQVCVGNNTVLICNIGSTSPNFSAAALFPTMIVSSGKALRAPLFLENEQSVDRRPRLCTVVDMLAMVCCPLSDVLAVRGAGGCFDRLFHSLLSRLDARYKHMFERTSGPSATRTSESIGYIVILSSATMCTRYRTKRMI